MKAATAARLEPAADRLLVVGGTIEDHRVDELPALLRAGDLLVVNDAATLPASLRGRAADGGSWSCACWVCRQARPGPRSSSDRATGAPRRRIVRDRRRSRRETR